MFITTNPDSEIAIDPHLVSSVNGFNRFVVIGGIELDTDEELEEDEIFFELEEDGIDDVEVDEGR